MAFSRNVGDFYGAHVLCGLGAAPFEALVAISVGDVWFAHERGSKLGVYVFGLAFGSFIGPLCSGYMAINLGWRWIYRIGAILTGVLFVIFYLTGEESRSIRTEDSLETHSQFDELQSTGDVEGRHRRLDTKSALKLADDEQAEMQRQISEGPKVGDVFDATGFTVQMRAYKLFPEPWSEISAQMWRPFRVSALPAVVWVSERWDVAKLSAEV